MQVKRGKAQQTFSGSAKDALGKNNRQLFGGNLFQDDAKPTDMRPMFFPQLADFPNNKWQVRQTNTRHDFLPDKDL